MLSLSRNLKLVSGTAKLSFKNWTDSGHAKLFEKIQLLTLCAAEEGFKCTPRLVTMPQLGSMDFKSSVKQVFKTFNPISKCK